MSRLKVELSDINNIKIVDGVIIKDENTIIYVEIDNPDIASVRFSIGERINVKIFGDKEGLKIYQGDLTYRLGGLATISNLTVLFKVQRRKDLKINIDYKTVITCVSCNPEKVVKVKFIDISAGGACFELENGNCEFEEGDIFETIFDTCGTLFFSKFKVLRKMIPEKGNTRFGCQFLELSVEEEQIVREFVFKTQLMSRKRMDYKLY